MCTSLLRCKMHAVRNNTETLHIALPIQGQVAQSHRHQSIRMDFRLAGETAGILTILIDACPQ